MVPGVDRLLAATPVRFLAARAICWPAQRTLFVADVHLGKAETFSALGVPVPAGATQSTLQRLMGLVDASDAGTLVILGDLLHARAAHSDAVLGPLESALRRRHELRVCLVRGNHDDRAGDPPEQLGIEMLDDAHRLGPFELCHHPTDRETGRDALGAARVQSPDSGHRLAGHLHPAVRLRGRASRGVRLPCFCVSGHQTILPAFGDFTGAATIERLPGETLLAIADDHLFELSDRPTQVRSRV